MILIVLPDIAAEDRLLSRARTGDDEALMLIYENYFPPVYNFIRLRVEDRSLAEDLASEVFIKLLQSLRQSQAPRQSLRGWIFKVARNLVYDHYRKERQVTTEALEEWIPNADDEGLEVDFIRSVNLERARRALARLAPDQQEVMILRFSQNFNRQETADIMGKSINAIKSLQFRAVQTLRQFLGEIQSESYYG
ncbi:MAG: sigma-70 family RNA polymerase sigma factor [Anaerolineae bacterium]|nr:sigma-70 family RNA polymerase sigma factor [Anaerolineae bacterium]